MRKIIKVLIFLVVSFSAFCETPELKMVMPNSWQKMTKISSNEANVILEQSSEALQTVYSMYKDAIRDKWIPEIKIYTIYQQKYEDDVFYRILLSNKNVEDCLASHTGFIQTLCYKGKQKNILLMTGVYGIATGGEPYGFDMYDCFMLIRKTNGTYGLLYAKTSIPITDDHKMIKECKNQIAGKEDADYFIIKDLNQVTVTTYTTWNLLPDGDSITISASDCLVEEKSPLKYSIQNAFDGDPATSYVENTADDLMKINCSMDGIATRIAIINGYAQNENLYLNNNRIKGIYKTDVLNDRYLNYQFKNNGKGSPYFVVRSIYSGSKYDDTCLAELNFYINNVWLFGDINE
jgi:hypothetical protein